MIDEQRSWVLWLPATIKIALGVASLLLILTSSIGFISGKALHQSVPKPSVTTTTTTTTTTLPLVTTTTVAALAPTTTVPVTTTTTQPVVVALQAPQWEPSDECREVDLSRLRSRSRWQTMRWCPFVAEALYWSGDWREGDLNKNMAIIACESNGRVDAINGTVYGLYQHQRRYWEERGRAAVRLYAGTPLEFDNPDIRYAKDQILVGVMLYLADRDDGNGRLNHWPNCGKW